MTQRSKSNVPAAATREKSLTKVLGESEQVTELVRESAEELSEVNASLEKQMAGGAGVKDALEKNAAVEQKVEHATERLTAVNKALESEIRDRDLVDLELAAANEQEASARHAAFHDVLTGLPNRALFNDRLEHGIAQAKRHGWSLAVMFIDLDKFKSINDTHGHDVGDIVLKAVAQRLKENARSDDTVARLGGDEFLYLLTEVRDHKDIAKIAEKIIKAVAAPIHVSVRGLNIDLSIRPSIGISTSPTHGITVDTLIISADLAMYQAKKSKAGFALSR